MLRSIETRPARRLFALALAATLCVGGLRVRATEARPQAPTPPAKAEGPVPAPAERALRGTVLGPDAQPVADAVVVVGQMNFDLTYEKRIFRTDAEGRFSCPVAQGEAFLGLVAHKKGLAPGDGSSHLKPQSPGGEVTLHLARSRPFAAMLVDGAGRPVAGAEVRIEIVGTGRSSPNALGSSMSFGYQHVDWELIDGGPLRGAVVATTDDRGAFAFDDVLEGAWLKLVATGADGRKSLVRARSKPAGEVGAAMGRQGFVAAPPGEPTVLLATPAARVAGRVTTRLPGVDVSGLVISYQASQPDPENPTEPANFNGIARTDEAGRFVLDGLSEGTININLFPRINEDPWTSRAAQDVPLKAGEAAEVAIELIRGVEVEGRVVDRDSARPVGGAMLGVYGPSFPRSGAATRSSTTDAEGRYRYRLPPGETYLYVMGPPPGFTTLPHPGSSRTVTIPDGPARFEVPSIPVVAAAHTLARLLDAAGAPVEGAVVVGKFMGPMNVVTFFGDGNSVVTDARGEFLAPPARGNAPPIALGERVRVRLRDKSLREATAVLSGDGVVTVQIAPAPAPAPAP